MKIGTVLTLVILLLFFGAPILTNPSIFPKNLSAVELGNFVGELLHFWYVFIKTVAHSFG